MTDTNRDNIIDLMNENTQLKADLAATRIAFEDWRAMHSTTALEAEIERLHEREMNAKCCHCGGVIFTVEDEWTKAKAEIERLQKERDEARGIATRSTLRSEKLRVIARQLYREAEGDDQHFDVWLANRVRGT